jgi:prophage DNA circulation protein
MIETIKDFFRTHPVVSVIVFGVLLGLTYVGEQRLEDWKFERRMQKFYEQQQQLQQKIDEAGQKKQQALVDASSAAGSALEVTNEINSLKATIGTATERLRVAQERAAAMAAADRGTSYSAAVAAGVPSLDDVCAEYQRITGESCARHEGIGFRGDRRE